MPEATEIDKKYLDELIDAAISARSALDHALRDIEKYVGHGFDGIDDWIDTCHAESLLEMIAEQEEGPTKHDHT